MQYCSVNGEVSQLIASNDRGLAYGDGLFTTGLVEQGVLINIDAHIHRLISGCLKLGIVPVTKTDLITYISSALVGVEKSVIKIIITSGESGRGYARSATSKPSCIVMVTDFPKHYATLATQGIDMGISSQRIGINPMLSGLKHLNRLEQVLLRKELDERIEDDLVVLNLNDEVIEATSANLFYNIAGKWYTPSVKSSGVEGLMRQQIINKLCDITIEKSHLNHLAQAQALFICNSVAGIIPVNTYNGKALSMDLVFKLKDVFNESCH